MTEAINRSDGPHLVPPPKKPRRWLRRLLLAGVGFLLVFGPWPVDDSSFDGSDYQARTLDRLDKAPGGAPAGPIRIGLAEVDLTPKSPRNLAGFIGQVRTPFVGVDTPCFARALTVESGSGVVTILTADLLLINAKMAKAVIERAGLRPDQVYFTSSHTHGGPGGWGDHPIEMLVAGAYDPIFFETLASQLADLVKRSRASTEPAEMAFVEVQARNRQKNRVDPNLPTHDALSALVFRASGASPEASPLAILAVFGAHATVSHPVPPRLGGDYPASLVEELKRLTGARSVLFASGAVGDASPARLKAPTQQKSAEGLGIALAADLKTALPSARFSQEIEVGNLRLDVDLPSVRLPFFASKLRFSPLATWWIADRRTHLHAIRLGPAVLVGFPGDYSGHLADKLDASTRNSHLANIPTSFDGDFRGYLVSRDVFHRKSCYETRWMSFYGPWTGEYFNDTARRMVEHLANDPVYSAHLATSWGEFLPRIALAFLLAWLVLIESLGRSQVRSTLARAGVVTVGIAATAMLAFEINPSWVDWAKFELPWWLRLIGLPLGILALAIPKRPGKTTLFVGVSCALLSANWVVVLMTLRGWIRSALFVPTHDHPTNAGGPGGSESVASESSRITRIRLPRPAA